MLSITINLGKISLKWVHFIIIAGTDNKKHIRHYNLIKHTIFYDEDTSS